METITNDLTEASRAEAVRMRALADGLAPEQMIRMGRDQFLRLATLIEMLAEAGGGCADPDCFHAPVGGFRWWVPLPEVERQRAELEALRRNQRQTDLNSLVFTTSG